VEYSLTSFGKKISQRILDLCEKIEGDFRTIAQSMIDFDKKKGNKPWQKPKR
jgi:hypothetical protein